MSSACQEEDDDSSAEPSLVSRRRSMQAMAAAVGAVTLTPVRFVQAAANEELTGTITGHLDLGAPDWVYIPFEVPPGVSQISVRYSYSRPRVPRGVFGNALDIGIFDERGIELGPQGGFRGWSGGFRTSFTISQNEATPGYLPGPVNSGTWHVIVGPHTVAPQGLDWTVQVTLRFGQPGQPFVPNYPPTSAQGRGRAWYRGDMHLHTVYSDGRRLPSEVAAAARAARLDFINSSDHNTSSSQAVWGAYAGPDLLILTGEEITTRNGHFVAAGLPGGTWIDWRYRAQDGVVSRFLHDLHRHGALAIAAHPYATCLACSWKFGYDGFDAVEVWNGPWTPDDEVALAAWDGMLVESAHGGRWLPAVGGSDAHSVPQVIGLPQTVVLADALSLEAILAGVRDGHAWVAESAAVDLTFHATGGGRQAGIGERLAVRPDEPVDVQLDVRGVPGGLVQLFTDEGRTLQATLPASGTESVTWRTTPRASAYVRAEVRYPTSDSVTTNPMAALTNPIFLAGR